MCDREEEINAFIPVEYWSLDAEILAEGEKKPIAAKLYAKGKDKISISSKDEMDKIIKMIIRNIKTYEDLKDIEGINE